MEHEAENVDLPDSDAVVVDSSANEASDVSTNVGENASTDTESTSDLSVDRSNESVQQDVSAKADSEVEAESLWNGEVHSLSSIPEFDSLPSHVKTALKAGVDRIRKGMERVFHERTATLAERSRRMDERERLLVNLAADFDGTLDELVSKRVEELTTELRNELQEARNNRADPAELAEVRQKLAEVEAERADFESRYKQADTELNRWRALDAEMMQKQIEAAVDEAEAFIKEHAPDLLDNHDAMVRFFNSEDVFVDNALALAAVRLKYPAPAKASAAKPAVEPPRSMRLNEDKGKPEISTQKNFRGGFKTLLDEMRRES